MKTGMEVQVLPAERGRRWPRYSATVLELPTVKRGKAKVQFGSGRTALVPLWRIVKP